jgi:hypothetical protein
MEWMLQVADEIDDALAAMRHHCADTVLEMRAVLVSGAAVAALWAVFLVER